MQYSMLLDKDHYVRYCRPQYIQDGDISLAFALRKGEVGLSGCHFEYYKLNPYENIVEYLKKSLVLKANGLLIKLNCGSVHSAIKGSFFCVSNPPHVELRGLDDNLIWRQKLCALIIEKKELSYYLE